LWARIINKRNGFDLAFIDIFDQMLQVYSPQNIKNFSGWIKERGEVPNRSSFVPVSYSLADSLKRVIIEKGFLRDGLLYIEPSLTQSLPCIHGGCLGVIIHPLRRQCAN
jgi:hypothetical protein